MQQSKQLSRSPAVFYRGFDINMHCSRGDVCVSKKMFFFFDFLHVKCMYLCTAAELQQQHTAGQQSGTSRVCGLAYIRVAASCSSYFTWVGTTQSGVYALFALKSDLPPPLQHSRYQRFNTGIARSGNRRPGRSPARPLVYVYNTNQLISNTPVQWWSPIGPVCAQ